MARSILLKVREAETPETGEILIYQTKEGKSQIEVRLEKETVWLNLNQMAELFDRDKSVISRHIANVFKEKELDRKATVAKFATVQKEGSKEVQRQIEHFNLDAIISVGYRVNSRQGTQFRIWATSVLRKHLVDGYTLNEQRLKLTQAKYRELQKAIALLGNVADLEEASAETRGIAQVIAEYSRALDLLDDFDHERLPTPEGSREAFFELTYGEAVKIIRAMRDRFSASPLMGQEKDQGFKSSLAAIYQTFKGKDLYATIQEKAAHLLYFVTKNHSFVDGNKRIAAALFICFLEKNRVLHRKDGTKAIEDNALVALTLMIAASRPVEKEIMIKVILNLLA